MPERGESEGPQRTEASDPAAEHASQKLQAIREWMEQGLIDESDMRGLRILVSAFPSKLPQSPPEDTGSTWVEVAQKPSEAMGTDAPIELDDAYYDEVRKAVGQGTRSSLFGTSTRSLERGLRELRRSREGELPPGDVKSPARIRA